MTYNINTDWVAFQVKPSSPIDTTINGLSNQPALDGGVKPLRVGSDIVALRVGSSASVYEKNQLSTRLKNATSIQRQLRVLGASASPVIETPDAIVNFASNVTDAQKKNLLSKQGAILVGPLGDWSPNSFRVRVSSSNAYASTVANALLSSGAAKWANPNLAYRYDSDATFNDPLLAQQWHLSNNGTGGVAGADTKATFAWDSNRGAGVKLCINDDGVDVDHEDLKSKYLFGKDFQSGTSDPRPRKTDNNHGTSVAGLALATGNNGLGVSGVAPDASLIAARIPLGEAITLDTIAESLVWPAQQGADIISCSWGSAGLNDGVLPDVLGEAVTFVTTKGRGGKGTILLYSAGNDDIDSKNGLNYHPNVITVTATTRSDKKSSYSNFGPDVDIAAPGGPIPGDMVTTDRTGDVGYSANSYTNGFNGTSAACPVAAGVVALILSTNPDLTREQVYSVLTQSADKIDPTGGNYDQSGRSSIYGYGRVNALRAAKASADLAGAKVTITTPVDGKRYERGELTLADGTTDEITKNVNVGLVRTDKNGKRLAYFNFTTSEWVTLVSPSTTAAVGMYAANFDDDANTWEKDMPESGGGYYQFLAQGFNEAGAGGKVVKASYTVDLITVNINSPTLNREYQPGSSIDNLAAALGTAEEDASGVGVALVRKSPSGQAVYHWDFHAFDQTANNWVPLNSATMMTNANLGIPFNGEVDWNLVMPSLQPGQYELRAQAYDSASVPGETSVMPFAVTSADGVPVNGSLSPTKAKVAAGKAIAFKATYNHRLANDTFLNTRLTELYFRARTGDSPTSPLIWIRYDIKNNVVSIWNASSNRWLNGYAPGTNVVIKSDVADLNIRNCKVTLPKGKKATTDPIAFTFSFTPRVSGLYETSIQCASKNLTSDWEAKGSLTVTSSGSIRSNSLDYSVISPSIPKS